MFKKLFDKFSMGKKILLALTIMIFTLSAVFVFFSTNLGAVAYEKFYRGNVLIWGVLHTTEDVTVYSHKTGNAGARNEIQGLPKVKLVSLGALSDGSDATGETRVLLDDSPTGEWTEVDAGTAVLLTADTTYYKVGANSLKIALTASAVAGDGAICTAGAEDDWTANELLGFWIYSTENLAVTDFYLQVVDATANTNYDLPAAIVKNVWTWAQIDISGLAGGTGDTVSDVNFLMSATGATNLAAVNVYLDFMVKWDADEDYDLGENLITDGLLSMLPSTTPPGTTTMVTTVEYTDFFLSTRSGDDFIVIMDDESANSGIALIAYQ